MVSRYFNKFYVLLQAAFSRLHFSCIIVTLCKLHQIVNNKVPRTCKISLIVNLFQHIKTNDEMMENCMTKWIMYTVKPVFFSKTTRNPYFLSINNCLSLMLRRLESCLCDAYIQYSEQPTQKYALMALSSSSSSWHQKYYILT